MGDTQMIWKREEQLPITHTNHQINTIFICRGGLNQGTIKWNWIEPKGDHPISMRFLVLGINSLPQLCVVWDKWQAFVMRAPMRSKHISKTSKCFRQSLKPSGKKSFHPAKVAETCSQQKFYSWLGLNTYSSCSPAGSLVAHIYEERWSSSFA